MHGLKLLRKKREPTRHNVPKTDGGHSDEAEVECLEEGPVLPNCEDEASDGEEDSQEGESQGGCDQIRLKPDPRRASSIFVFPLRFRLSHYLEFLPDRLEKWRKQGKDVSACV